MTEITGVGFSRPVVLPQKIMKQSMVLLHGLFGGLSNWNGVVAHFQSTYDIHIPVLPVYDQPGKDHLGYLANFLSFIFIIIN